MSYYFAIVGHNDNPLFEQEFLNSKEVKVKLKSYFFIEIKNFMSK